MKWLLRTMYLIHVFGSIFCLFKPKPRNPEANMNVSEIISYWDYIYEEYEVVTQDGYILPVYRIPQGKNESSNLASHILTAWVESLPFFWLVNPPSSSLGFSLADAGFDVWLGNSKGNTYARKQVRLDPDSKEFWAFRVWRAPVVPTLDPAGLHIGSSTSQHYKIIFGEKDIFSSSDAKYVVEFLCQRKTIRPVCNNLLTLLFGYNPQNLMSRFDVYVGQAPAGTSVQTMLHYSQSVFTIQRIRKGVFQAYDWESSFLNMLYYSQPTPPLHKVKDMKVPTAMWSGGQDFLADPIDVKKLEPNISNLVYHKKIVDYNHLDFIIGLDAPKKLFKEIVTFIKEDESG